MKFLASLSLALCCVAAPAFAQTTDTSSPPAQTEGGHHRRGGGYTKILRQLNLTQEQQGQIAIIRKSGSNGKERRKAIMNVLNADQKKQFRSLMKAQRQSHNSSNG